jgi:hypothetical protein
MAVQAQLVDDFSGGLGPYTQTIVLAQNADPALAFSIGSGALLVGRTFSSGGNAQQDLFLRNDYSLAVGNILRVDTAVATNSLYSDFGIVVSATVNPPAAVWTSGTASTRQDYIDVYVKGSYGTVGTIGFDGTTQKYSNSGIAPTGGYPGLLGLYISRPSASEYDVGYTTASGDTLMYAYTGITDTTIGNAIGFYADVRATTTFGSLDNLRLVSIPEPSAIAMCGMGLAGLFVVMRRRN